MKYVMAILVAVVLCMFVSCYADNINRKIYDKVAMNISVSMENGREVPDGSRAIFQAQDLNIDSSYYIDEVQGDPAYTDITPVEFILDIDRVMLFNPRDNKDMTKGAIDRATIMFFEDLGGSIIPDRVNMLSSKKIYSMTIPHGKWGGLSVMIRPGGNEATNGMHAASVFCVKLPEGIERSQIINAMTEYDTPMNFDHRDDNSYAWIGFSSAVPLNVGFSYICLADGLEGIQIINANNDFGSWVYGPEESDGNQAGIALPMDYIDLSELEKPEFVFMFDTDGCMEMYEVEPGRFMITLKKSNPFPFKIITEEYDCNTVELDECQEYLLDDVAPPMQCFEYDWTRNGTMRYLIFTYTRPNANGVDTIRIYSSSEETWNGSTETLVYEGSDYCYYVPWSEDLGALHYFITAVNSEGAESAAVPFLFEQVEFELNLF